MIVCRNARSMHVNTRLGKSLLKAFGTCEHKTCYWNNRSLQCRSWVLLLLARGLRLTRTPQVASLHEPSEDSVHMGVPLLIQYNENICDFQDVCARQIYPNRVQHKTKVCVTAQSLWCPRYVSPDVLLGRLQLPRILHHVALLHET